MRATRHTTSFSRQCISYTNDCCETAENTSVTYTHLLSSSETDSVCDKSAGLIGCHKSSTEIFTTFGIQKATQQIASFWIVVVVSTTRLRH
jgi:hypothetical protein